MNTTRAYHQPERSRVVVRWLYVAVFVLMAFTGFGQMPIFKRYYISDIPGMAWSADFYFTHYLHYIGAILLLGLIAYATVDFLMLGRGTTRLRASAYARIALLVGIVLTGVLRVMKNLPDVTFSPTFTLVIDISHLGFVIGYIMAALLFAIFKSGWLVGNPVR